MYDESTKLFHIYVNSIAILYRSCNTKWVMIVCWFPGMTDSINPPFSNLIFSDRRVIRSNPDTRSQQVVLCHVAIVHDVTPSKMYF